MTKEIWETIKQTVNEFLEDNVLRLAAALAYYSIFSLAPLLLIAVSIAGAVFGDDAANGLLDEKLQSTMGASAAQSIQDMLIHTRKPADNIIASLTGLVLLIVGAGGVFGQLQDALNTVWGIKLKSGRGIKGMIKDRFLSFSMVLGCGFLLLTSLILTTTLQAANDTIALVLPLHPVIWKMLGSLITFAVISGLFAAIFKVLPDAKIEWKDVGMGAVVTAGLFVLGKFALSWYLGREATSSSYGSAGSLVIILLWIYYSATILLFGAEFTQVHARIRGRDIMPNRGAIGLKETTQKSTAG
jgi:membrane protein